MQAGVEHMLQLGSAVEIDPGGRELSQIRPVAAMRMTKRRLRREVMAQASFGPVSPVAEAAHGLDGVAADLGTQVVDMDLDGVALDVLLPAIEPVFDLALRRTEPGRSMSADKTANSRRERPTGVPATLGGRRCRVKSMPCHARTGAARPAVVGRRPAPARRPRRDQRACRDSRQLRYRGRRSGRRRCPPR